MVSFIFKAMMADDLCSLF